MAKATEVKKKIIPVILIRAANVENHSSRGTFIWKFRLGFYRRSRAAEIQGVEPSWWSLERGKERGKRREVRSEC